MTPDFHWLIRKYNFLTHIRALAKDVTSCYNASTSTSCASQLRLCLRQRLANRRVFLIPKITPYQNIEIYLTVKFDIHIIGVTNK
ncbi:hypothetical protein EV207_10615 [Scopulibacillus darangshiensis]|uniref:Uncharacterized protein n=1 Tax=Scopulibacillus darangshiensis TaxID=442528 RepID=A0A4R2P5V2_9BACL|nr:hypothetical protein EV207_10615 [Scopulibacillus darangshiensis]